MEQLESMLSGEAALRVLNLESSATDSAEIQSILKSEWPQLALLRVDTQATFLQALEQFKPAIIISCISVPEFEGAEALRIVRSQHPEIPFIFVSDPLSDIQATTLIKAGAKDYLLKNNLKFLPSSIRAVIAQELNIRARKAFENQVHQNEIDFRRLIENSPIATIVDEGSGADEAVLLVNKRFTELFGYTIEDLPNVQHWWPLAYPDEAYRASLMQAWLHKLDTGDFTPTEATVTCKDGSQRHVKASFSSISDKNIITFEDLTETKLAEAKIQRLNKIYAVLSQCNEHIMHCSDRDELFSYVCRDAVLIGGLKMAWIGIVDPQTHMVQPITSFGDGSQYLDHIQISTQASSPYGKGPTGISIRENKPFWCQDFKHDPATAPWHERGAQFGWGSSASLPLVQGENVIGALTIYASETHMFDDAVKNLLLEMTANISFAVDKMTLEAIRSQQQHELASIKNALQETLDAIPDMLFDVSLDGTLFKVHAPKTAILIAPASELIGRNMREFLPPTALEICRSAIQEAETQGWSTGKQYNLPEQQSEKWYELSIAKRHMEDESESRFIVLARDITQRKNEESKLHKLLQAVEQSSNVVVITDLEAKIEYANPAFTRTTGYELSEVIGAPVSILKSGKTPVSTYAEMWGKLTHGNIWFGEFINKRKDGTEYIEAAQISPVSQPDGTITHYLAIKEDITAKKSLQERIEQNNRRMSALLKLNEMGGVLPEKDFLQMGLELAENQTQSKISFIHFVNKDEETIELVTWSTGTLQNYCTAGYDQHYPVSQAGIWADCLRQRRPLIFNDYNSYPHKHGLPEGHAALKRLVTIPIIEEGKVKIIMGVGNKETPYSDEDVEVVQIIGNDLWRIARRVRVENELKESLKEERQLNLNLAAARTQVLQSEKMASIGILAAGVAHEINNPVGFVNSNLGTLEKYLADIFTIMNKHDELCDLLNLPNQEIADLRDLKKKLDIEYIKSDIKSLLKESREGLDRVKKIVLDLKNFSRSESDEHWQWADVHQGLESTLTIVWNELKYKCEVHKEYGNLPKIYCLPSQLNQVFMNLLVNAAQAIEKRGIVTIRTHLEEDQVAIEISDTGTGIPKDVLPRIFDPFFTTKPVGTGTGLGLPVSYGIIERHHGKFEVDSEVGKGSTFRIKLPINQPTNVEKS